MTKEVREVGSMIVMDLQLDFQSHGIMVNQMEAAVKIVSSIGVDRKDILENWVITDAMGDIPQFVSKFPVLYTVSF